MPSDAAGGSEGRSSPAGVRVRVLGAGTLVPDDAHRSACHLVQGPPGEDGPGWTLLLDCGFGAVHGLSRFGIDPRDITHLVLSHFHLDHVGDLAPLLFTYVHAPPEPRSSPLTLVGPPGLRHHLQGLAGLYGDFVSAPPFPQEVVELPREGSWEDPLGRFRLHCAPTWHTPESVAWRVECSTGPVVGYTGDTGPKEGLGGFLSGADLLIAECSFNDPPPWDGHLSPSGVARLAREARPGLLVLTHRYPDVDGAALPHRIRDAGWAGAVAVAADGDEWPLGEAGPPDLPGRNPHRGPAGGGSL